MKSVVCVGAANIDLNGFSRNAIIERDSNPGTISMCPGGVGRNIAENLARLGVPVKILSVIGDDEFGKIISETCVSSGMDISELEILPNARSSAYLVLTDNDGDMYAAISDMHILKGMGRAFIQRHAAALDETDAIVIDPGLSPEALDEITSKWQGKAIFSDPVSTTYAGVLKPFLPRLTMVKSNRIEAEILSGETIANDTDLERAADKILAAGTEIVIITLGADGAYYKDRAGISIRSTCRPLTPINATGAGDAFTAAAVFSYLMGYEPEKILDFSIAAAGIAMMHRMTVNPEMSLNAIQQVLSGQL